MFLRLNDPVGRLKKGSTQRPPEMEDGSSSRRPGQFQRALPHLRRRSYLVDLKF